MQINTDQIIYAKWIIPIEPENIVLENYALVLYRDKIIDILPQADIDQYYKTNQKIILPHHVLMPGFINAHTHTPMTLFRGLADDLAFMDWLNNHIWPAEKKWLSRQFCYDGARLAILEMIASGTTCFNDNYFFVSGIAQAVKESHMRACLGACLIDLPTAEGNHIEDYLAKFQATATQYQQDPLIAISLAPHAPYSLSNHSFEKIRQFIEKNSCILQIHLQESVAEITQSLAQYQQRPIERLHQLGLLSSQTQAIHCVQSTAKDIDLLKKTKTHVVHCPESNLKLANGFCPVQQLLDAGINVALGTDGACSNNDLDMLGELKTASLLAKGQSHNPKALTAFQALKMATLHGAKAMGIAHQTGSLRKNKQADCIAIDLSYPNTQPLFNIISQVVYAAHSHQISDVWIAGCQVFKNRQYLFLDQAEILSKANQWKNHIKS